MDNLLPNELDELIVCSCCHLTFNDTDAQPKLFSCRHYFCLKCITTILLKGKELYCIHCWKRTELPQPDMKPESLPTYNAILYLSQNMINIKTKKIINDHQKTSSQFSPTSMTNKMRSNENCLTHAMPNSLWCLKCNILVCRACASTEDHRNHTVKSLNEAKESIHNDILAELMKMQKKLTELQHLVFKQRDFLLKILEACTTLKTQIETELINHIPTLEISDIRGNLSKAKLTLTLLEHQPSPADAYRLFTSLNVEKQRLHFKYNEMLLQCKLEELVQNYGSLLDFDMLKQISNVLNSSGADALQLTDHQIIMNAANNNITSISTSSSSNININNNNNHTSNGSIKNSNSSPGISGHNNMILLLANYCISQLYSHHILTTKTMAQAVCSTSHVTKSNMLGGLSMLPDQMGQLTMHDLHKFSDSPSSSAFLQTVDLLGNIGHIGNGSISSFMPRQHQHATTPDINFMSDLNGMMGHHSLHSTLHHQSSGASVSINSPSTTTIAPIVTPQPTIAAIVQNPSVHVYPIYFFNIEINGSPFGRVLIEVRNDVAPKMAKNFGSLCTGELGFGYKGCSIFQCWENESIITGDFELNNGRGGRSVFEDSFFMPDDTKILAIRGSVGMRRSQKRHDNLGLVGSQFRIILREMRGFTGIFAFVVEGLDLVDKISKAGDSAGKPQSNVIIVNCGKWQ